MAATMLKGLADSLTGKGAPPAAAITSPEFDELYNKDFKTTPEWTQRALTYSLVPEQLITGLRDTVRLNQDAVKNNTVVTCSFLNLMDDPRAGQVTQELAHELHNDIADWHTTEATNVEIIRRAEAFLARFQGVVQQTSSDVAARNRALTDLNARRGRLEQRLGKAEEIPARTSEPGATVPAEEVRKMTLQEEKVVKNADDVEVLRGQYDVVNRQAISGMRKVREMRPRVAYAVLYAYAHYQHNALGTYPVRTHSERLMEQNPKLVEASDWDDVEIDGKSIKSILARDDMAEAKDAAVVG